MLDDLRNYLQLASGLTEATTAKARDAVGGLLAQGMTLSSRAMPAPVSQVQDLADDLVATSRENREMLVGLIRAEVDRAVGRMGFVREDELAALRRHVLRLEKQIADFEATGAASEPAAQEAVESEGPGVDNAPAPDAPAAESAPKPARKKRVLVVDEPTA